VLFFGEILVSKIIYTHPGLYFCMVVDQDKIHKLSLSDDVEDRLKAVELLDNYELLTDKYMAWSDLIRLMGDENDNVRQDAAFAIHYIFEFVPDKYLAWFDLHRLTSNTDWKIRQSVAISIDGIFKCIPDKCTAWKDLINLMLALIISEVRWRTDSSIRSAFNLYY
jgi:hypothetical protein